MSSYSQEEFEQGRRQATRFCGSLPAQQAAQRVALSSCVSLPAQHKAYVALPGRAGPDSPHASSPVGTRACRSFASATNTIFVLDSLASVNSLRRAARIRADPGGPQRPRRSRRGPYSIVPINKLNSPRQAARIRAAHSGRAKPPPGASRAAGRSPPTLTLGGGPHSAGFLPLLRAYHFPRGAGCRGRPPPPQAGVPGGGPQPSRPLQAGPLGHGSSAEQGL